MRKADAISTHTETEIVSTHTVKDADRTGMVWGIAKALLFAKIMATAVKIPAITPCRA